MTSLQKTLVTRAIIFSVAAGGILVPSSASAQIVGGGFGDMVQQLREKFAAMSNRRIVILPDSVTVDSSTRTAVLKFENTTIDTLEAEISVHRSVPGTMNGIDTSEAAPVSVNDTVRSGTDSSRTEGLATWLRNVPSQIRLAPGEVKTVTVTVDPPPGTPAGVYTVWIVAATDLALPNESKKSAVRLNMPKRKDGKPFQLISTVKAVYRVP